MYRIRRIHILNPVPGVAAETDLNCIVIEIRHARGARDVHDSAHPIPFPRRGNVHGSFGSAGRGRVLRIRARWGTVRAVLRRRLRNVVINGILACFGRIYGKEFFLDQVRRAGIAREHPIALVELDVHPDIVGLRRHPLLKENVGVAVIGGAEISGYKPGLVAYLDPFHFWRLDKVVNRRSGEDAFHEIMPQRAGPCDAADVFHRRIVRVPNPYARDQIGSISDRPVVAPVICGAGLGGGGTG